MNVRAARAGWRFLLLLVFSLLSGIAFAETSPLRPAIPETGPQSTLFDIFTGDSYSGMILVEYENQHFRIIRPQDVLDQIKGLQQKEEVLPLVSGTIDGQREITDVGTITFSDQTFRVVLKLQPRFFKSEARNNSDRLDPATEAEHGVGFRTDFGGSAVKGSNTEMIQSGFNRTSIAWRNTWLQSDGNLTDGEGFDPIEIAGHALFNRFQLSGGFLRASGQRFTGDVNYAGVSLDSIDQIASWQNTLRNSTLQVFVPERSIVRFYRGREFLSEQILDFGLQQVDTRSFPQGSYPVEVVIIDKGGNEHHERKFFASSGLLALEGYPAISLQGGELRDKLDISSEPFFQGRTAVRVRPELQLEGKVAGTNESTLAVAGFLGLQNNFIYGGGAGLSSTGSIGFYGLLSGSIFGLDISADYNGTTGEIEQPGTQQNPLNPGIGDFIDPDLGMQNDVDLLAGKEENGNFIIQKIRGDWSYRFSGFRTVGTNGAVSEAYGPSVYWRAIVNGRTSLNVEAGYLFSKSGDQAFVSIGYQYRFLPWSTDVQFGLLERNGEPGIDLRPRISYQDTNSAGRGTVARLGSSLIKPPVSGAEFVEDNVAELRRVGQRAEVGAFAGSQAFSSKQTSTVGGILSSSLVIGTDGTTTISSPPGQQGTFVADIVGNSDAEVMVVVDGAPYARIPAGTRTAIGLAPYRRYRVRIRPADPDVLLRVDDDAYDITMFPGNVVTRHWRAEKIFVGMGRIVSSDGQPILRARIIGPKDYTITDDRGYFQAELSGQEKLSVETENMSCQIELPRVKRRGDVEDYGDVICDR